MKVGWEFFLANMTCCAVKFFNFKTTSYCQMLLFGFKMTFPFVHFTLIASKRLDTITATAHQ